MPYKAASQALKGLVVLDLTHARAGPVCVRQLADWGADVIRIERPGDPADIAGRHEADFQNKHRNKRDGGSGGIGSGKSAVISAISRKGNVMLRRLSASVVG